MSLFPTFLILQPADNRDYEIAEQVIEDWLADRDFRGTRSLVYVNRTDCDCSEQITQVTILYDRCRRAVTLRKEVADTWEISWHRESSKLPIFEK